jgi:hypothetical protein
MYASAVLFVPLWAILDARLPPRPAWHAAAGPASLAHLTAVTSGPWPVFLASAPKPCSPSMLADISTNTPPLCQ